MKTGSLIMIGLLVTIIATLLLSLVVVIKKDNQVWCNTETSDSSKIITGKIMKVFSDNIHVQQINDELIIVHHSSNINFKVGQKVTVIYDGKVTHSLPPQTSAICIEVISESIEFEIVTVRYLKNEYENIKKYTKSIANFKRLKSSNQEDFVTLKVTTNTELMLIGKS